MLTSVIASASRSPAGRLRARRAAGLSPVRSVAAPLSRARCATRAMEQIVLVDTTRADQGELRVATLDGKGITRTGSLVVRRHRPQLRREQLVRRRRSRGERYACLGFAHPARRRRCGAKANTLLSRDATATRMSAADWHQALPMRRPAPSTLRGRLAWRARRWRYGDMNGDGAVTLADALYIMNASVGLNDSIPPRVETNGTRRSRSPTLSRS